MGAMGYNPTWDGQLAGIKNRRVKKPAGFDWKRLRSDRRLLVLAQDAQGANAERQQKHRSGHHG